jgi:itaconate CoA-transferase
VGLNHPTIAPYGAYTCRGGELVVISIQNDREWVNFCAQVLGSEELADDSRFGTNVARCANRPALDEVINKVFVLLDRMDLAQRLLQAKIAFGAVNSVADLSQHPQLRRTSVVTPSGPVELVAPPVRVDGEQPGLGPVPALGEHSEAIRREFLGAPST